MRDVLGGTGSTRSRRRARRTRSRSRARTVPDLVLMDLRLPDLDGAEALRRLAGRSGDRCIPVVALTALRRRRARGAARGGLRRLRRKADRRAGAARRGAAPLRRGAGSHHRDGRLAPWTRRTAAVTIVHVSIRPRREETDMTRTLLGACALAATARRCWRAAAARARLRRRRHDPAGGQPLRDRPDRDEIPRGRREARPESHDVALRSRRGLQRQEPGADGKGGDQALVRDRQQGV